MRLIIFTGMASKYLEKLFNVRKDVAVHESAFAMQPASLELQSRLIAHGQLGFLDSSKWERHR